MTRFYGGLIVAQDCGQKVLKLLLPAESGLLHRLMFFDSSGIRYIRGRGKNDEDEEKLGVGSCTQLLLIIALSWKLHLHTCRIRPTFAVKVLRRLSPFLPFFPPPLYFSFCFLCFSSLNFPRTMIEIGIIFNVAVNIYRLCRICFIFSCKYIK